ncbi:unnamed protein product [Anisakis simplex]|uniref:39S ribosomal protein L51, mitochondrial (inferred by orthology to a C. elegans protein) n=1 Tax=Anisakis simplex TaxID=6269 RepID=A0A0M3JJ04_ANISI|nr:unnamed protein product [Anisakis simplex]
MLNVTRLRGICSRLVSKNTFDWPSEACCVRQMHDRSGVPRVVDDHEEKMYKTVDAGYYYRYHRKGIDPLPRIPNCRVPVARPKYKGILNFEDSFMLFSFSMKFTR